MTGFEPATSCSQSRRATKLRYIPLRYCVHDSAKTPSQRRCQLNNRSHTDRSHRRSRRKFHSGTLPLRTRHKSQILKDQTWLTNQLGSGTGESILDNGHSASHQRIKRSRKVYPIGRYSQFGAIIPKRMAIDAPHPNYWAIRRNRITRSGRFRNGYSCWYDETCTN
jgi:hypothetical protein